MTDCLTISPHPRPSLRNWLADGTGRILSQCLGSAVQAQTQSGLSCYHHSVLGTALVGDSLEVPLWILSGSPAPAGPRASLTLTDGRRDSLTFMAVGLSAHKDAIGRPACMDAWFRWDGMDGVDGFPRLRQKRNVLNGLV